MGTELATYEPYRDLGEQAGTVTCAVRRTSTTMIQPFETLNGKTSNSISGDPVEGGDEPDAAGVTRRTRIKKGCRHHSLEQGSDQV